MSDRPLSFVPILKGGQGVSVSDVLFPEIKTSQATQARKRKLLPALVGKPARAQSPLERVSISRFYFGK